MESKGTSHIEVARKVLHRKSLKELEEGTVLAEAIELALQPPPDTNVLERLSYIITLFRQLTAAVSQHAAPKSVVDPVHRLIGPALLPRGTLATMIMTEMNSRVKPHPQRATEALTAATRLVSALPAPGTSSSATPYLLQALFNEVARAELGPRGNLVALSIMLETVPIETIPDDLLGRLLAEFRNIDGANIRCAAIATIVSRRRDAATGSEEDKDRIMFQPLLRTLAEEDDAEGLKTLSRYLLPPLFKDRRSSFPVLLDLLANDDQYFPAWITMASYGVSSGIINITGVSTKQLQEALEHEDSRIRILAFELVAMNKTVLEPHVMELVKMSLRWNDMIPQAGPRTDMGSAIFAFLTHLKALELVAARDAKKAKTPESTAKAQSNLTTSAEFHHWFLEDYLTPAIGDSRAMPAHRAIFGLRKLRVYLDVYSDRAEIIKAIYTPERVDLLIACQGSEFAETRSQARAILSIGPQPLPGYETVDSPAAKTLLASARASINHPRKTQAEAGRAALCILFTKLIQPSGNEQAVSFVTELVDLLEMHLVKTEENLSTGIVEYPLYGLLSAITDIIRTVELTTADAQTHWTRLLHRLSTLVDRVWAQTRKVVSLGPSEDPENETAAHEIARAYEVLGDGDDEGDEAMDHNNLLSGCWRATKEAAELLSVLLVTPLSIKSGQQVWSKAEVRKAGLTFLTWLHEIRHRGTFARIAVVFGHVVDAVKSHKDLRDLVDEWLEVDLEAVAKGHLSTLRRSAALPFSFLSLVSGDQALLDRTVERLVEMAKLGNASSDVTKVHAMNCLKTVLLDAKQTRFLSRYFERTVMVSLAAFGSSNWNVRNVGLILFSTITHRSLTTGRSQELAGTRAGLATRQTLASWHKLYPSLIPHISDYLRRSYKQGPATLTEHSPLFPILIILRSLRWSEEGARTAEFLFPVVERYLSSVEWQVREVASQALSSLVSPKEALEKAKVTATRISHQSDDLNLAHGRLLFLRRLFADVVPWSEADNTDKSLLERHLKAALQGWAGCQAAVIPKAVFDCINEYAAQTNPTAPALVSEAKRAACGFLYTPSSYAPGIDLLHDSAAETVLIDAEPKDILSLLATSVPEDAQLIALDRLVDSRFQVAEVLTALIALAQARIGNALRTKLFDVLSAWPSSPEADKEIAKLGNLLEKVVKSTRCVPLREAALGALGRATVASDLDPSRIALLAERLEQSSNESTSEPSRMSALRCLEHLAPLLFASSSIPPATIACLQRSLLRLLEDDDEEIRLGASEIVCEGLGPARPIVQVKAVALWWDWVTRQGSPEVWAEWLWDVAADEISTNSELAALKASAQSDVLFLEEPPNMFRNSLWDASYAATALAAMQVGESEGKKKGERVFESVTSALATPPASPIDDAWAARWALVQRRTLLARALGA